MRSTRQRIGFLLILAGVAVPLAIVSVAFACGRLATLHLSPNPVRQGAELSGYGRNYTAAPTASEVTLRLDSRSGRVLWSGRPLPNGTIQPRFTVPNVRSGYHTILAVQTVQSGAPSPGTPARAAIRIGSRRRGQSGAAPSAWPVGGPPGGGGSGGGTGLAIGWEAGLLGALLSGALLGSGAIVLRGDRRRRRPAALPS